MESLKRIRSTNWSEQEKKVLRMLVLERAEIIENKDTSTNSNSFKKVAWEEVLLRFNSVNTNKRDMTQLLNQWRNMKNKAKKAEFAYRRARAMTGGGPPPHSPPADDRELIDALPNEFIVDTNCFDSDSIYVKQLEKSQDCERPARDQDQFEKQQVVEFTAPALPAASQDCESPASVLPGVSQHNDTRTKRGPSHPIKKKQKKISKTDCCFENHEHQLFILAKTAREEAILREKEAHILQMSNERELHTKRMAILNLEEEFWAKKINSL